MLPAAWPGMRTEPSWPRLPVSSRVEDGEARSGPPPGGCSGENSRSCRCPRREAGSGRSDRMSLCRHVPETGRNVEWKTVDARAAGGERRGEDFTSSPKHAGSKRPHVHTCTRLHTCARLHTHAHACPHPERSPSRAGRVQPHFPELPGLFDQKGLGRAAGRCGDSRRQACKRRREEGFVHRLPRP